MQPVALPQAPYLSQPPCGDCSRFPLRLLSPPNPLTLGFGGGPAAGQRCCGEKKTGRARSKRKDAEKCSRHLACREHFKLRESGQETAQLNRFLGLGTAKVCDQHTLFPWQNLLLSGCKKDTASSLSAAAARFFPGGCFQAPHLQAGSAGAITFGRRLRRGFANPLLCAVRGYGGEIGTPPGFSFGVWGHFSFQKRNVPTDLVEE